MDCSCYISNDMINFKDLVLELKFKNIMNITGLVLENINVDEKYI